jgi:hypothetical protein
MRRVIASFACLFLGIAASGHAFGADATRSQHRNWIRKLETPGGTFPRSLDLSTEHDVSEQLVSEGTAVQHRSWIRKMETPDGMLGFPL